MLDAQPAPPAPPAVPDAPAPSLIDQLILWLIEHPGEPKKKAAAFFGVREQFIYTLTNSDLFKAKLQDVLREKFQGNATVADIHAKLAGLMEMSIDKLTDTLRDTADPKFISEVALRLLASQTKGPSVAVQVNNQTNVSFQVDARTARVAQARSRMLEAARIELASRPPPSVGDLLPPSPFVGGGDAED